MQKLRVAIRCLFSLTRGSNVLSCLLQMLVLHAGSNTASRRHLGCVIHDKESQECKMRERETDAGRGRGETQTLFFCVTQMSDSEPTQVPMFVASDNEGTKVRCAQSPTVGQNAHS